MTLPDGISELDHQQCFELLRQHDLGRLVVSHDGEIDIFPVNYVVSDNRILFRTRPGSKLATLAIFPGVLFEVDQMDFYRAWSVVVRGKAELRKDVAARTEVDSLGLAPFYDDSKEDVVEIEVAHATGRELIRAGLQD